MENIEVLALYLDMNMKYFTHRENNSLYFFIPYALAQQCLEQCDERVHASPLELASFLSPAGLVPQDCRRTIHPLLFQKAALVMMIVKG